MKKVVLSIICTLFVLFSINMTAFSFTFDENNKNTLVTTVINENNGIQQISPDAETNDNYSEELLRAYKTLCEYFTNNMIPVDISLETFRTEFENGCYSDLSDYLESYYSIIVVDNEKTWNGDTKWYYNNGTTLLDQPNYSTYNLLNIVQSGDIIYEAAGGSGLTGHIAIVEGIYYDTAYSVFYIRIIEAIGYVSGSLGQGDGVVRSVFDDDRYTNRSASILRVSNATTTQKTNAVSFCIGQIGKDYKLDLGHDTSSSEKDWYCSELVWAAYYNQGIDLETPDSFPGVIPSELLNSSLTSTRSVSTIGTPTINYIALNSTSATIGWTSISGASKYYIYRASTIAGGYTLVANTTSTNYTNTGLTTGSTYYYRVAAYKTTYGNMSPPIAIRMQFTTPIIIKGCPTSPTSISLQWSKVYGNNGYRIYRSTSSNGTYTNIGYTTATTYSDTSLSAGTTYYYKIAAYNSNTTTTQSGYVSIKPAHVQVPTIYYAIANNANSVTIKWTNVPNASSYSIYRSLSASGTYSLIDTVSKHSYKNTGLSANTTYYYKVVAKYNGYSSGYSGYKSIKTASS